MKSSAFPRSKRISGRKSFEDMFRTCAPVDAGGFRIYRREKPEGLSRLGLSVSRQVGSAVHRNRVKRAVREWFRASGAKFRRPADILVVFRKEVPEALVKKLAEKLDRAFAF